MTNHPTDLIQSNPDFETNSDIDVPKPVTEKDSASALSHQTRLSVSVVITAFNRSDYLYYALQSVLTQMYPVYEIIVVDDCSSVDLRSVIDRFENQDGYNKILYHRLSSNSGANVARNTGVVLASGEWVAFLDDDDVWLSNKIFEQVKDLRLAMDEHEPIATLCSYRFLDNGEQRITPQVKFVESQSLKRGNPYCGASGLLVKRDVIAQLGFDDSLPCGQDWDVYVRLSKLGVIRYVPKDLYLYRRGSHQGLTTKAKSMSLAEAEQRLASAYKHQAWLGKKYFRKRAAGQILSYVFYKDDKFKWIKKSVEIAGISTTLQVLGRKLFNKLRL